MKHADWSRRAGEKHADWSNDEPGARPASSVCCSKDLTLWSVSTRPPIPPEPAAAAAAAGTTGNDTGVWAGEDGG